jgi:hypothetical protein
MHDEDSGTTRTGGTGVEVATVVAVGLALTVTVALGVALAFAVALTVTLAAGGGVDATGRGSVHPARSTTAARASGARRFMRRIVRDSHWRGAAARLRGFATPASGGSDG